MKIRVLYFASLREKLGVEREEVDVPEAVVTVGAMRAWLCARGGIWADALAEGRNVRVALNQRIAKPEAALGADAELAFFPPVTGG